MKVGVIGLGVVGGALYRAIEIKGFNVAGYDKYLPAFSGHEKFKKILNTDLVFLCLPTPTNAGVQEQGSFHEILTYLSGENYEGLVVVKSTVLPGTTERFERVFKTLNFAHNPEFLTAARPYEDLLEQPVILVGATNAEKGKVAVEFWQAFDPETPIMTGLPSNTEMAKYAHNCFLATKLSFFNDIYEVCERLHIDYQTSVSMAIAVGQTGSGHTKVPGEDLRRGWGGMCFPKDTSAFFEWAKRHGLRVETLKGAMEGNQRRRPAG